MQLLEITDLSTVMDGATKLHTQQENEGYILQRNAHLSKAIVATLRQRQGHTAFQWVKGHHGHLLNKAADALAGEAVWKERPGQLNVLTPLAFALMGAKLTCITQKLAYHTIQAKQEETLMKRARTEMNLENITADLAEAFGVNLPHSTVWKLLKTQHFTQETSYFY